MVTGRCSSWNRWIGIRSTVSGREKLFWGGQGGVEGEMHACMDDRSHVMACTNVRSLENHLWVKKKAMKKRACFVSLLPEQASLVGRGLS